MSQLIKRVKSPSWRTTGGGLVAAIGTAITILGPQFNTLVDGDPKTMPDWTVVSGAVMMLLGLLGIGLNARDDSVTSEQAQGTR